MDPIRSSIPKFDNNGIEKTVSAGSSPFRKLIAKVSNLAKIVFEKISETVQSIFVHKIKKPIDQIKVTPPLPPTPIPQSEKQSSAAEEIDFQETPPAGSEGSIEKLLESYLKLREEQNRSVESLDEFVLVGDFKERVLQLLGKNLILNEQQQIGMDLFLKSPNFEEFLEHCEAAKRENIELLRRDDGTFIFNDQPHNKILVDQGADLLNENLNSSEEFHAKKLFLYTLLASCGSIHNVQNQSDSLLTLFEASKGTSIRYFGNVNARNRLIEAELATLDPSTEDENVLKRIHFLNQSKGYLETYGMYEKFEWCPADGARNNRLINDRIMHFMLPSQEPMVCKVRLDLSFLESDNQELLDRVLIFIEAFEILFRRNPEWATAYMHYLKSPDRFTKPEPTPEEVLNDLNAVDLTDQVKKEKLLETTIRFSYEINRAMLIVYSAYANFE